MDADTARRIQDLEQRLVRLEALEVPGAIKAWTPTYYGATTAGVTTYSIQTGLYARVGPWLLLAGRVAWTNATGTGRATIGGLPFAANPATNMIFPLALWLNGQTWSGAAGTVPSFRIDAGFQVINFEFATSNAGVTNIPVETAGDLAFSAIYAL